MELHRRAPHIRHADDNLDYFVASSYYQLYAENRTVALKLNPITNPLKPVFEKMFAPFIDLGVIEILTGGVEIGSALAYHPGISAVHMTGE